jgi:RHS repeat-associated protein
MTKFVSTYRVVLCPQQAGGNRVAKHTYTAVGAYKSSTFYVRDASGNFDSSYSSPERRIRDINPERNESGVMLGSSWPKRNVGLEMPIARRKIAGDVTKVEWIVTTGTMGEQIIEVEPASVPKSYTRELGHKQYELSNHLGNVLVVVNDIKRAVINNNVIEYYTAQVVSATDYSPFGVALEGRTFSSEEYRYGFNGKEKDEEGIGGGNQTYDYGFRIYNPSLAKFLSVDPISDEYPMLTLYQFASNTPVSAIDIDGLEAQVAISKIYNEVKNLTANRNVTAAEVMLIFYKESSMNAQAVNLGSDDYGLAQINSSWFGNTINDGGYKFTVSEWATKNQWWYNASIGVILADAGANTPKAKEMMKKNTSSLYSIKG